MYSSRQLPVNQPGRARAHTGHEGVHQFHDVGWHQAQQYQFAAFQAVVANQIGNLSPNPDSNPFRWTTLTLTLPLT